MTWPEDGIPHGRGQDGMGPCAAVEVWVWSLDGGVPRVTFGGLAPRGNRAWRVAIWRAIAAEALAVAEEEEGSRALGSRAAGATAGWLPGEDG